MSAVLTLISDASTFRLTDEVLASAADAVRALGARPGPPVWLDDGRAADIAVEGGERRAVLAAVSEALGDLPVDRAVQPARGRRKRLLVADMDSTIIGQECIDELAAAVGLRDTVAAITERAMRGELDFEAALRERAAMLKDLPVAEMERVLHERIRLNRGARTLTRTMRRHGAKTALVSGGFSFFTARIRDLAGFDSDQANELVVCEGRLTGVVREPILGRDAKLAALRRLAAAHGLGMDETMAVGDGANDLAMIEAAGTGVAFHAKPAVAALADVRIVHTDLTSLLFIQGYAREAFADGA